MQKVLLVDDTPEQLAAYKRLLHSRFYVLTANDGRSALDLLERDPSIDVIVSDMCMPCMNGIDFFMEAAKVSPDATRIMLTGHADLNSTIEAINRGQVFRYLQKPCSRHNLIEAIEAGLALRLSSLVGRAETHAPSSNSDAEQDLTGLAKQLRQALGDAAIQPYFQPIVDLRTELVEGAEALARWPHPVEGWIPPSDFIPVAEQHGLMPDLGLTILHAACQQAASWAHLGFMGSVSVNVSTVQFSRCAMAHEIKEALDISGLPANQLTIEVTESVLIDDPTSIIETLEALRAFGVSIAIDDFGTGYSSLAYLKHLPVDRLKIDRCFVDEIYVDERNRAFVQAMLDLARKLDLVVVAEGIERPEQREILAAMGCDLGQGYLFNPALSADAFMQSIRPQPRLDTSDQLRALPSAS